MYYDFTLKIRLPKEFLRLDQTGKQRESGSTLNLQN